ncbi:MAG TPA: ABC transporter permease [Candidatus Angelobacter sp.]|nr:ABC transporter permease [Candidatus Angelobacter sp.]
MHNVWLIARREYLERVRTRSFMIMTVLTPVLMAGLMIGPGVLAERMSHHARHMVVVASDQQTGEIIKTQLLHADQQSRDNAEEAQKSSIKRSQAAASELTVDIDTDTSAGHRADLVQKLRSKELDGVVWASNAALQARKVPFITRNTSSFIANDEIQTSLNQSMTRRALQARGLSDQEIQNIFQPVKLDVQDASGNGAVNPQIVLVTSIVMVMILYMSVLMYGINVMRAVLEEKTSRIMEVMLSVAKAKEMLAGKILGVGAVGLTQIGIWAAVALVYIVPNAVAMRNQLKEVLSPGLLIWFAVFYLLGYALYSTMYAAIGSMVNSEQEAQQLQFVAIIPLIAALAVMVGVAQMPSSPLAIWCSMIPFTSPLIMFMRIAVQTPPLWQIGLSVALLVGTIYVLVLLCAKIYRVGILMYGKRPTLPEMVKWLKYA